MCPHMVSIVLVLQGASSISSHPWMEWDEKESAIAATVVYRSGLFVLFAIYCHSICWIVLA